jgi:hypothetical protein
MGVRNLTAGTLHPVVASVLGRRRADGRRELARNPLALKQLAWHLDCAEHLLRESGYGRADVLITPKGRGPGVVLELKVIGRRETAETALESALEQLRRRDYAGELRAAHASPIHQMGVVFDGKRCWVAAV